MDPTTVWLVRASSFGKRTRRLYTYVLTHSQLESQKIGERRSVWVILDGKYSEEKNYNLYLIYLKLKNAKDEVVVARLYANNQPEPDLKMDREIWSFVHKQYPYFLPLSIITYQTFWVKEKDEEILLERKSAEVEGNRVLALIEKVAESVV